MKASNLAGLFLITTIALSSSIYADSLAFLCIEGIPGGTTDKRNPDCIDITSLSVDFSLDASYQAGSGLAAAAPTISPFTIVKHHDVASVRLQEVLLKAIHIPSALIRFFENCDQCEPPEHPYLVYNLEEVIVTRHNTSYFEGGSAISEIVDLSFRIYGICAGSGLTDRCDNGEFRWNLAENQEP